MKLRVLKDRLLVFVAMIGLCFLLFHPTKDTNTHAKDEAEDMQSAYLACFIDDQSFSYKSQVIYSAAPIEVNRVTSILPGAPVAVNFEFNGIKSDIIEKQYVGVLSDLILRDGDASRSRLPIKYFSTGDQSQIIPRYETKDKKQSIGIQAYINQQNGQIKVDPYSIQDDNRTKYEFENVKWQATVPTYIAPMSFPYNGKDISEEDINRAYQIQDLLMEDFMDALIFINDGRNFENSADLIQTAYVLLTSTNGSVLENQYGNKYTVNWGPNQNGTEVEGSNGYLYYITINRTEEHTRTVTRNGKRVTETKNVPVESERFNYRVKKGYADCNLGEDMENYQKNTIARSGIKNDKDTVYISWDHIFLEAGILYGEGITYSNQGDLYYIDDLESGLVKVTRSLLTGIKGFLQPYKMEDLIFNSGIRASNAFVLGAYYDNWSPTISLFYLIFMVIAVSLVIVAVIRIILKKQLGTFSSAARFSMMEGIKDLIITLFLLSFTWLLLHFVMLLNYEFVDIWKSAVSGKRLMESGGNFNTLSAIIYQFFFFVIEIYVNFVYIIRSLMIPALIITSPLFVIAFSFGTIGKKLTGQWFKEFIGNVFIQSIHAFVYGLILVSSLSLRGIEKIVVCASFIPLTAMFKQILGIGGDQLLKAADGITKTATAGAGAAVAAGAKVAGGIAQGAGTALGGVVGFAVGGPAGAMVGSKLGSSVGGVGKGASNVVGGVAQSGFGVGQSLTSSDGGGNGQMSQGLSEAGRGIGEGATSLGTAISGGMSAKADTINRKDTFNKPYYREKDRQFEAKNRASECREEFKARFNDENKNWLSNNYQYSNNKNMALSKKTFEKEALLQDSNFMKNLNKSRELASNLANSNSYKEKREVIDKFIQETGGMATAVVKKHGTNEYHKALVDVSKGSQFNFDVCPSKFISDNDSKVHIEEPSFNKKRMSYV